MARLVPAEDPDDSNARAGLFFVEKKIRCRGSSSTPGWRTAISRRRRRRTCPRPPPSRSWRRRSATSSGSVAVTSGIEVPEESGSFFRLPALRGGAAGLRGRGASTLVVPVLAVLPMDWSWALRLCLP
eukprot:4137214-Pyramimonas_sp.AAC.1